MAERREATLSASCLRISRGTKYQQSEQTLTRSSSFIFTGCGRSRQVWVVGPFGELGLD